MFRFIYVILANVKRGPYLIPLLRRMIKNPDKYTQKERYATVKRFIHHLMDSGRITTEIYGMENLPKEGGYIMYPNHQGKFDALAIIYAHEEPCSFVMDEKKSHGFLVKEIVDALNAKRLEKDNVRQGVTIINEVAEEVKAGEKYILFSEGGYNKNHNTVQEFKSGSFKAAMKADCPIVPVALIDTYIPFNSLKLGKCTNKVIFLKPIYAEEYTGLKSQEIAALVKGRIMDAMRSFGVDPEPRKLLSVND